MTVASTRSKKLKVKIRALNLSDFDALEPVMRDSYRDSGMDIWSREQIQRLIQDFPEGQMCAEVNGKPVGAALSIIIRYEDYGDDHTYAQITGNYLFNTHNPKGDTLYGVEVFVHPEQRGLRLGRRFYDFRKELCENLNLRSIVAGGRIPGYHKVADHLSPKEYIEKVRLKELYDPILTFQLSNQFHVRKILRNYLVDDSESMQFATLLEWNNVFFEEKRDLFDKQKSHARLGLVQWQMRRADKLEDLVEQIEFFVDAVSSLEASFVLFPEFINAPLMMQFNQLPESEAIRKLAEYTEPLMKKFCDFAVAYNTNIITGSMPYVEDRMLFSICYLCRRDGSFESYRKIHISPGEVKHWGMVGGDELKAFDTDCGKIGILISDDIEYPELGRLYADQGVSMIFVPFSSATPNDFQRIKCCAQARAIENECYVAIAGGVGNLPKVSNMDTHFAQSAVFSPSDYSFPINSTVSEASPNTEMTLVADVDLSLLRELHLQGSSRNLLDRRTDLYSVNWLRNKSK
jgi:predicted amidohydrolase/ribosomal protein S18 acetylase RimI-like enzyme